MTDQSLRSLLEDIQLAGTVVMVISLPFSESLKLISIGLTLVATLVRLFCGHAKIKISWVHVGFAALLLTAIICSIFADNSARSFKGARDVLYFTIPLFVASTITGEQRMRVIVWSLFISSAAAAALGILSSVETHKALEVHSLGNSNYTAMFFVMVICSMASMIIFSDRESMFAKLLIGLLCLVIIIATVMTVMRASFLGLFVFAIALFFSRKQLPLAKLLSLGLLGLIVLTTVFLYKPMWAKLFSIESLISRLYIWQHSVEVFKEHPLIGIGLNHFSYTFPPGTPWPGDRVLDAHSVYMQTLSQMGVLGTASIGLIIFAFLDRVIRTSPSSRFSLAIEYSALGAFSITFVAGIFDTTLHHEHAILLTLFTGLMHACYDDAKAQ